MAKFSLLQVISEHENHYFHLFILLSTLVWSTYFIAVWNNEDDLAIRSF